MLRATITLSILVSSMTSCSTLKGLTGSGGKPAGKGWAESMAEAPKFDVPNVIEVKTPNCNASGYTRVAVDEGKPFHIVAKTSGSCAAVEILNGNGQAANTAGNSVEVCAQNGPITIASTGQAGGTYIGTAERYGCTGITVTLDAKLGEAQASAATGATGGAPNGPATPPPGPNEPTEPPTM